MSAASSNSLFRRSEGLSTVHLSLYPWQSADWQRWQQMRDRLPHAILFHGAEGIGKVAFAEHAAQSLLCESPDVEGHACGDCASCGWFVQYSHPGFRRVRPEALDAEEDEATPEADESSTKKAAASKTPSRDIRIEQVRSLATFMNVSTHRAGSRVVMLYPAEAMNPASANALLKTLEEPPPDTVFLLVTHRIDRLLPTILSRCRQFPLQMPAPDKALSWLESQEVSNPARWLAEHGGAPLAALAAAVGEFADAQDEWLAYLARPHTATALVVAERLQKVPLSQLVAWQQRWLYDLLAIQSAGRVRYYPHHRKSLEALAAHTSADSLQQALRDAGFRRAVSEHPLSARLFIEDMLLDYVRLMQPPRAAA